MKDIVPHANIICIIGNGFDLMHNNPSQNEIQGKYQAKIRQINVRKKTIINKRSAEIRSRYAMPKIDDFAEV